MNVIKMTLARWEQLTPEEKSKVARQMTQGEWDLLFPPQRSDREPSDASGFTGDVGIWLIS